MRKIKNIKISIIVIIIVFSIPLKTKADLGWTLQQSGTNQNLNSICFINSNSGFVAGANGVLLKTTNGGVNWNLIQLGTNNYLYCVRFPSTNVGYIAGANGILIKSTNSGINWSFYSTGANGPAYSMSFLNDNLGYLITYLNTFIKTINGGVNWSLLPSGVGNINSVFFSDANTGFIAGSTNLEGRIEKTTNGGINSFSLNVPYSISYNGQYFNNSNTGYSVGNNGLIIKTTDGGNNWYTQSVTNNSLSSINFPSIDTGYACGYFGTILRTTNAGLNWSTQQNYASSFNLHEIHFINNITGYAVGDYGTIIKTTTGGEPIGIEPISNNVPLKHRLSQNYPNPFNLNTIIKYALKENTSVALFIYNILGQRVKTLVNEYQNAGYKSIIWDGTNENGELVSSGIYFYKLTAGNFVAEKKMLLLK